ncbi:response regulator transcription factor, partial [Streptosporangium sandarakinum]
RLRRGDGRKISCGYALLLAQPADDALHGATHDAARCRRALRDLGVESPLPRGRKGNAGALSQREKEVARLVALGRTNREIADVLFLSTRTVETHVATVLRKLGLRSRTEVAPPV